MAEALAGGRGARRGRRPQRGARQASASAAIEAAGGKAIFQAADALDRAFAGAGPGRHRRDSGARSACWSTAPAATGRTRTLPPGGDFCKLPLDAWQGVFDLNLVGGALLPSQVFGETMVAAGRGSIINIASMAAILPLSRVVAYSAAKAAVLNLTQFLAREWATNGRARQRHQPRLFPRRAEPGHAAQAGRQLYRARRRRSSATRRWRRFGEAHELAGAVVWLAAPRASSFVTGQNIVVDGGFSAVTI